MVAQTEIDAAYAALKVAFSDCLAAAATLAEVRHDYDTAEAERILVGLLGKNDTERKAWLYQELKPERSVVEAAEQMMRQARCRLDIAQAEVDRVRCILRLLDTFKTAPYG